MNLFQLLALIDQNINTKTGNDRITGAQDNMVRKQMIQALIDICSSGFGGDIAPTQNPGTQIKPIYYFATEATVYPFCGNVEVLTLPAFIVWNGSAWSIKAFEIIVNVIAPESQAKGIVTQSTVKPSVFVVNDWYLFVGPGTLNWPGTVKDAPGVVYCTSVSPEAWAIQKFGSTGGGIADAPADGKQYARKDAGWEEVTGTTNLRTYSIDFGTTALVAQEINMFQAGIIDNIVANNVATILLTYAGGLQQAITAGVNTLAIPSGDVLTWEITRTTEGQLATLGIHLTLSEV